jgi:phosphoesterase RecJ-like protein
MILSDIVSQIKNSKRVHLITHINPDGDAIGSVLGLGLAIKSIGIDAVVLKNDEIPEKYRFLPGQQLMAACNQVSEAPDTIVVLDCGDEDRLGDGKSHIKDARCVINIDHHISNTMFGNMNLVDANAAATAEIVYQLIKLMGVRIDLDIAACIFTAIVTDTGCFRYDSTTWVTHAISGELISLGLKTSPICDLVFSQRTLPQTMLIGKAIDSLKTYHGGRTAVMIITEAMLKETGSCQGDVEGLIDFARDIKGVQVAVLIKESDHDRVKVAFRSKDRLDVSALAARFGGGGHKRASGCIMEGPIDRALGLILDLISISLGD